MNAPPFTPGNPLRLAMWSGPRNLSTALMRSWGNRDDTVVCDEPFYAHFLLKTQRPHPLAAEVIASQENDWQKVAASLTGAVPGGKTVYYQKHMSHHLLPEMGRAWLTGLTHAFLIRDPREVVASLDEKFERPLLADTGLPQQVEIFDFFRRETGRICPVVDAGDLLTNPRAILEGLCRAVGLPFQDNMLHWPAGPRATDGIWAKHWYDSVNRSSGFQPRTAKDRQLPAHLRELCDACQPLYEQLHAVRIQLPP